MDLDEEECFRRGTPAPVFKSTLKLAAELIGPGIVPIGSVLYVDATSFMKNGSMLAIYGK